MSNEPILAKHGDFIGERPVNATVAKGGLHFIGSNAKPYFTLTCDVYEHGRDVGGGADHGKILEIAPQLKPLADLHLADADGVPMHAQANGWYWLAGATAGGLEQQFHGGNGTYGKRPDECLALFAKHARISAEEAAQVRDYVAAKAKRDGVKAAKALFAQWIEDQKPRWAREARECIESLGLVVFGDNQEA